MPYGGVSIFKAISVGFSFSVFLSIYVMSVIRDVSEQAGSLVLALVKRLVGKATGNCAVTHLFSNVTRK